MATPKFNSKSPTIRRILREAQELSSSPSADYTATPLESDLFEWHFTFRGPPNSAFAGGIYHGRIVLPATYPLRPPSFRFVTPSGRFETNREICLSISGHHEETWQPAWGVRTALVALRSFMETDPKGQLGGLETGDDVRKRLAAESRGFRCGVCGKTNGEIMDECERATKEHEEERTAAAGSSLTEDRKREEEVQVPSELKLAWRDELVGGGEKQNEEENVGTCGAVAPAPPSTSHQSPQVSRPTGQQHIQIRQTAQPEEDSESDELAEGFVPTDPLDSISRYQDSQARRRRAVPPPPPPPQPGQRAILQPTGTSTSAAIPVQQQQQQQQQMQPIPQTQVHPQQIPSILIQRQQQLMQQRGQIVGAGRSNQDDHINAWIDRLIVVLGTFLAVLIIKVLFW